MITAEQFREQQKRAVLETRYHNVEIAYIDAGEGSPVILLHGIPTWSYLFHQVIPHLQQHHRVIVPDLAGYGYSDKRDCFDRSIRMQAELVVQLMDQLSIDRATVLGHDIGGGAALVLAVDHEERLKKLILSNIVAYHTWPNAGMVELADPLWIDKPIDEVIGFVRGNNFPDHDGTIIDSIFSPYMDEQGKLSLIRNASGLSTNHTMEIRDRVRDIKTPTLLLWGTEDPWQEPWIAEQLERDITHSRRVFLEDASHWVPLDCPMDFSAAIHDFMTGTD